MAVWSDPCNSAVFFRNLFARQLTPKELLLIHLCYLEKQKEENLRAKGRLLNLPNPPEKDQFVDKLIYLKKNMQDSCFPICP